MKTEYTKLVAYCIVLLSLFVTALPVRATLITVPHYTTDGERVTDWDVEGSPFYPGPPPWTGSPGESAYLQKWNYPLLESYHSEEGSFTCEESLLQYETIESWSNPINYFEYGFQIWNWVEEGYLEDHGHWEYHFPQGDVWVPYWVWIVYWQGWVPDGSSQTWNTVTEWRTVKEAVPEPATICLFGLGALSLIRRKK